MLILPGGRVYLAKGETIPVWCPCGNIYQPRRDQLVSSTCRECGRKNMHQDHDAKLERPS